MVLVDLWVGSSSQQYMETLITETTINGKVKVRGGPMRGCYSTSERTTDNFIKASHVMAAMRRKLKEKLSYVASSAHKEVSPGSRSKHGYTVRDPTNELQELFDPFLEAPAQYFKSGCKLKKAL